MPVTVGDRVTSGGSDTFRSADVPCGRTPVRSLPTIEPAGTVEAMRGFFKSAARLVRALYRSGDETAYTPAESDELKLERELRRGPRGG